MWIGVNNFNLNISQIGEWVSLQIKNSCNPGALCSAFPSSQRGSPTHSDVPRNLGNDGIVLRLSFANSQTNVAHYSTTQLGSWPPAVDPTQLTSSPS